MKLSYNSEELIQNVLEDIDLFGKAFKVFAIYEDEFITDYIDCDIPTRNEVGDEATEFEFQKAVSEYKNDLKKLEGKKYIVLSLQELFFKLNEQNSIL